LFQWGEWLLVHKTNIDKVVKIGSGTRPASGSFCAENRSAREPEKNRINRWPGRSERFNQSALFFPFLFMELEMIQLEKKKRERKRSALFYTFRQSTTLLLRLHLCFWSLNNHCITFILSTVFNTERAERNLYKKMKR
jgi:hypothetical protein